MIVVPDDQVQWLPSITGMTYGATKPNVGNFVENKHFLMSPISHFGSATSVRRIAEFAKIIFFENSHDNVFNI